MKAMNDLQMLEAVKSLSGDASDYAQHYLDEAKAAMVVHVFPFNETAEWEDVPARYHHLTCEIAAYLINKRGAEGETQHIESDVSRTYESSYIPSSMFSTVVPYCGVPR